MVRTYARKTAAGPRLPSSAVQPSDESGGTVQNRGRPAKITDFFFKSLLADPLPRADSSLPRSKEPSRTAADSASLPSPGEERRALRQTYLDLGQRDLFMTVCGDCGTSYDRSFPQDVARHALEHARAVSIFKRSKVRHYEALARPAGCRRQLVRGQAQRARPAAASLCPSLTGGPTCARPARLM